MRGALEVYGDTPTEEVAPVWRPAILQKAEAALLDEKASKLLGLARVLDQQLGSSFDAWVVPGLTGQERLDALAEALRPLTDNLAAAFGAVGLGYYDAGLDRIVAYAPSGSLGSLVGVCPPEDHLGRVAMREGTDKIAVGSMVRGDAMNCMHPLVRGGKVIGFAFANESLEDIYRQIHTGGGRSYQATEFAAVMGLSSLAVFAGSSALSVEAIRQRLAAVGEMPETGALLAALGQVEQYVQLFLNNLQAGVLLTDAAGQILFCSQPMTRLSGLEPAQVVGRSWQEVLGDLGVEVGRLAAEGQARLHCEIVIPDGRRLEVELLSSVTAADGSRVVIMEDAGQARKDSGWFERAERLALAGELATAIAHEIRNPLTVVAGSVQLIPQRLGDQEFLLSLSQIAGQELARVNRIIQGLLGFARYSEPQMALLDLTDQITQAVEFIRWYAQKHGVQVTLNLYPGRVPIHGDAEHLRQALLNLMMNGIQAMEQGGELSVGTEYPSGSRFVRVTIADTGPGIESDRLPKIWEVFYSSKPGGTGLGLPVVQRIVDEHRGQVAAESAPGKGTCFTVLLPLATRPHVTEE